MRVFFARQWQAELEQLYIGPSRSALQNCRHRRLSTAGFGKAAINVSFCVTSALLAAMTYVDLNPSRAGIYF